MKKRLLLPLALFAIIVLTGSAIKYRPHTVPLRECSDIYCRYATVPGIDASYIKEYPVNDTLSVDVTLLQATDTAAWRQLSDDFHLTDAFKNAQKQSTDSTSSRLALTTSQMYYSDTTLKRTFIGVASPLREYICIFHCSDTRIWDGLFDAILKRILFSLHTKEDIVDKQEIDKHPNTTSLAESI